MPKHRAPSFDDCLDQMRKRNALRAEEAFLTLRPRASDHIEELMAAFHSEKHHGVRCWLLELIGEAKSERAFNLLCEQALSTDESFRSWAQRGLQQLNTPASRQFLFEHNLR